MQRLDSVVGVVPDPTGNFMPKLTHFQAENTCYFVTTTTQGRQAVFIDQANCQLLCNLVYNLRAKGRLLVVGFAIMPEHFHLLVIPRGETTLSWIMQELKKSSARLINRRSRVVGKLWLDEYYERAIRNEAQLLAALRYVHRNPVAAGLARREEEYPYSSANPRFENDLAAALGLAVGVETTPTTE